MFHHRRTEGRRQRKRCRQILRRILPIERLETRSLLSGISLVDDHSVSNGQDLHGNAYHVLPTLIEQDPSLATASNEPGAGGHPGGCCCSACVPTGMVNPQPPTDQLDDAPSAHDLLGHDHSLDCNHAVGHDHTDIYGKIDHGLPLPTEQGSTPSGDPGDPLAAARS